MPLISIIIPIYNVEKYLAQCLDSIIRQDLEDCEVILIDDGSTDNSASICQQYISKYDNITFIHKENGGVSSARNMGLDVAKGQYICFVDADDWVEPSYIQTLKSYLHKEETAEIIFFSMSIITNKTKKEEVSLLPIFCRNRCAVEEEIYSLRYAGTRDVFGWTWDKIFKANVIKEHNIRFPENVSFREDELFTFEFCRYITTLRVIEMPLYNYQVHECGLTSKNIGVDDFLPSSVSLEKSLTYYKHEGIKENMIHSITSYRALHIYKKCRICKLKEELKAYQKLTQRIPQSGKTIPIQHLTQYLKKGFIFAYLYCLIRKL